MDTGYSSSDEATVEYGSKEYPIVEPNYAAGILPPSGGIQYTYGQLAKDRNKTNWYLPAGVSVQFSELIAPEDRTYLANYLGSLLKQRGVKGHYKVWSVTCWNESIWSFKFVKGKGECPLHKEIHDAYNFEYKVKKEMYGGWKCWKDDGWETHYQYEELPRLVMCDFTGTK